jgi:hypothetical protein
MIWLNFAALVLALFNAVPFSSAAHALVGLVIIVVAVQNRKILHATECPARIKRIASVMVGMSLFAAVTGVLLRAPFPVWVISIAKFLHITAISALFTQSASVATSFDMWHEKEFV